MTGPMAGMVVAVGWGGVDGPGGRWAHVGWGVWEGVHMEVGRVGMMMVWGLGLWREVGRRAVFDGERLYLCGRAWVACKDRRTRSVLLLSYARPAPISQIDTTQPLKRKVLKWPLKKLEVCPARHVRAGCDSAQEALAESPSMPTCAVFVTSMTEL